jgi:hypothetical protein
MKKAMLLMMSLLLSGSAYAACKKGYIPDPETGVCMESSETETNPAWVSSEKPPKDKMPSYEREGVHALTPPSLAADDIKKDEDKAAANKEGKRAAGIN